jgi:hypothetical protein
MVSTGPAARIQAEAPKYADALLAREASELRQTEFAVGPVFLSAGFWSADPAEHSRWSSSTAVQ